MNFNILLDNMYNYRGRAKNWMKNQKEPQVMFLSRERNVFVCKVCVSP